MTDDEATADILNFQSRETSARLRPDPYHLREVAARLHDALDYRHLDPAFSARVRQAIVSGLHRLDSLPRDDPFWADTNRRPTFYKLQDFGQYVLRSGPGHVDSLWLLAAVKIVGYTNDFGLPYWREMNRLRVLDASWPVNAAYHVSFGSGPDVHPVLIDFLNECQLASAARPALDRLRESGDDMIMQWAAAVIEGLRHD